MQRLAQYGRYQTSFSGRMEAEDHQPNESLKGRSNGPPALRTTAPVVRPQLGGLGGRGGHFGARSTGKAGAYSHSQARGSVSVRGLTPVQRGGKRQHYGGHGPQMKKQKSQHEETPFSAVSLAARSASSCAYHSQLPAVIGPPPRIPTMTEFALRLESVPVSHNFMPHASQPIYPTPSPSNVSDTAPNPSFYRNSCFTSFPPDWMSNNDASESYSRYQAPTLRLDPSGWPSSNSTSSASYHLPHPLLAEPCSAGVPLFAKAPPSSVPGPGTQVVASAWEKASTDIQEPLIPLAPLPTRRRKPIHPNVSHSMPKVEKQIHSVPVTVKRESEEPVPVFEDVHAPPVSVQPTNRPLTPPPTSCAPPPSAPASSSSSIVSLPLDPAVKQEPTVIDVDAFPEEPQRKLITTRCERYEMPENCKKSHPQHQMHRKRFMKSKLKLLEGRGFMVKNRMFREDGMVLEWISPVSVSSDTLEPPSLANAINSALSPERQRFVEAMQLRADSSSSSPLRPSRPSIVPSSAQGELASGPMRPRIVRPSQRDLPAPKSPKVKFKPVPSSKLRQVQNRRVVVSVSSVSHTRYRDAPAEDHASLANPDNTSRIDISRGEGSATQESSFVQLPVRGHPEDLLIPPLPRKGPRRILKFVPSSSSSGGDYVLEREPAGVVEVAQHQTPTPEVRISGNEQIEGASIVSLAQTFLLRWIETFDEDRSLLGMAYASSATFSASVHETSPMQSPGMTATFCTRPAGSGKRTKLVQGRRKVVESLLSLGPYLFEYDNERAPVFDMNIKTINIGSKEKDAIFMSVHGEVVSDEHVLSVDQAFVLCRPGDTDEREIVDIDSKQEVEEGESSDGEEPEDPWPLLAIAHQMVVRDRAMLFPAQWALEEPWIANIMSMGL